MNTYSGPIINRTTSNFSTRDSLGIDSVSASISGEICDVVNTVTPKPYYWAFIVWACYDCYAHVLPSDRKWENAVEHIRKNNYYISLGNILANGHSAGGFVGQDTIYNSTVLSLPSFQYTTKTRYIKGMSTMNYYPPGLQTMGLLISSNPDTGEVYKEPRITPEGELLAKSFDEVISKTRYYQEYRLKEIPVPRDVLIELGTIVRYDLKGFDHCKEILIRNLFKRERTRNLASCQKYVSFIHDTYHYELTSSRQCRHILYDMFSPCCEDPQPLDPSLKETADSWEIVIGRQYFTAGLSIIWNYMMSLLTNPMTMDEWIRFVLKNSQFENSLKDTLESIMDEKVFTFSERESIIAAERRTPGKHSLENGLSIILSVYNRFENRPDISLNSKRFFHTGENNHSISLHEIFRKIEYFMDKPIEDFLYYIMKNYLILQHLDTAFTKMQRDVDGYYLEVIEGKYILKHNFSFDFQGIRLVQLYSVMTDLELV